MATIWEADVKEKRSPKTPGKREEGVFALPKKKKEKGVTWFPVVATGKKKGRKRARLQSTVIATTRRTKKGIIRRNMGEKFRPRSLPLRGGGGGGGESSVVHRSLGREGRDGI